jgi:hypothetical protein
MQTISQAKRIERVGGGKIRGSIELQQDEMEFVNHI